MTRYLLLVDHLSAWIGKTFAWSILLLTLVTSYDILTRKFLGASNQWAYDTSYMLYGTLFMLGGAYTLSRNAMVRGDMLYRTFPVRVQASLDLILYLLFFFPGVLALVWSGFQFAEASRLLNERSTVTPNGPIIWPFKYVIPLAGLALLVQGIAEVVRTIQALHVGAWPRRLADVEETETRLAREEAL